MLRVFELTRDNLRMDHTRPTLLAWVVQLYLAMAMYRFLRESKKYRGIPKLTSTMMR